VRSANANASEYGPRDFAVRIFLDFGFGYLVSRALQTGASHRRAMVCEQLAQGCYLRVQWLGIEPTTSRSLGPTR